MVGNGGLGISGRDGAYMVYIPLMIGGVSGGGKCMGWYDILGSIP